MIKHRFPLALLLSICSPLGLAHLATPKDKAAEFDFIRVLSAQPIYETMEYRRPDLNCDSSLRPPAPGFEQSGMATICSARTDRASPEEVIAYRVHYRYHGHDYITEMPYDPGTRLPVDFDVQPIRW